MLFHDIVPVQFLAPFLGVEASLVDTKKGFNCDADVASKARKYFPCIIFTIQPHLTHFIQFLFDNHRKEKEKKSLKISNFNRESIVLSYTIDPTANLS